MWRTNENAMSSSRQRESKGQGSSSQWKIAPNGTGEGWWELGFPPQITALGPRFPDNHRTGGSDPCKGDAGVEAWVWGETQLG